MKNGWVCVLVACAVLYGLLMAAPSRWVLMDLQRLPGAAGQVLAMTHDDLGNKYIATPRGLSFIDKSDNVQIFTKAAPKGTLTSDSVTCLAVDRYRALWIGTDGGGLNVYDNGRWRNFRRDSTHNGPPDDGVLAVAVDNEDRWVGTRNGFALLRGGVWTTYSGDRISGRLPNRVVTAIAVDASGNKWIGTIGGLVKFTGTTWTQYTVQNTQGGVPHDGITCLLADTAGSLWVGTQAGVARLSSDGKWTNFQGDSRLQELAKEVTYSLSLSPTGDVWACIRGGSARCHNGNWDLFTKNTTPALLTRYNYSVMAGAEGEIWFGTEKGVSIMYPPARDEEN